MSLTLTRAGTTVELDPDLLWVDEYEWNAVVQTVTSTINGALVIQQGVRQAGRPITLQPDDDSSAWMSRAVVDQLKVWADTPLLTMTLSGLRGATRTVMFRQQDGAHGAAPVVHYSDVDSGDNYRVTLRLMEV